MYLLVFNYSNTRAQILLNQFAAFETKGTVSLFWQIAAGNTCNGTVIQHSTDSINFNIIGSIAGVCGSITEPTSYSFRHNNPAKNKVNFYRLLLGNTGASIIISILVLDEVEGYLFQQNPITDKATLFFKNDNKILHTLYIYNLNGILQYTQKTKEDIFQIFAANLTNGHYIFILESETNLPKLKGKFVVQQY